jgi:hypothetical protein
MMEFRYQQKVSYRIGTNGLGGVNRLVRFVESALQRIAGLLASVSR